MAEENASANHSVEKKQGREDSSVVNVHLNGCDEISSSGSTVNSQTSNSDSTSDGMVNLQPSTNDHASGDGSTPNPQPSSSNHSSESDSTALPSCSDRNSVTFSAPLSLGSASVTSTSTITSTGQGIAYPETFCAIKGTTTTLETKKINLAPMVLQMLTVHHYQVVIPDGASVSGNSECSTSLGNQSPFTNLDSVSNP